MKKLAQVAVLWAKIHGDKLQMRLAPDIKDDNYDVHFHFSFKDVDLPSIDLHLSGAVFLSLLSALSGWVMKPRTLIAADVMAGDHLAPFRKVGIADLAPLRYGELTDRLIVPAVNKAKFDSVFGEVEKWGRQRRQKLHPKPEVEGAVTIIDAFGLAFEEPSVAEEEESDGDVDFEEMEESEDNESEGEEDD